MAFEINTFPSSQLTLNYNTFYRIFSNKFPFLNFFLQHRSMQLVYEKPFDSKNQ